MKNKIKLFRKIEQSFIDTIYSFISMPFSFYLERDIECYMYSNLSKIDYISIEPFKVRFKEEDKKQKDVLLHSQWTKYRKKAKGNKEKGYFDIVIFDDEKLDKEYLFIAVELKHWVGFNTSSIRKDIINLLYFKNNIQKLL